MPSRTNVSPGSFRNILKQAAPFIYSISFSGGEPMLFPALVDELIGIADELLAPRTEIDLVTNGTNIEKLPHLRHFSRLSSIHLSRHAPDDIENRRLMNYETAPSLESIRNTLKAMSDSGKVVLNCVLQENSMHSIRDVVEYLDFAISAGVANTAFISMFKANDYCVSHYISPEMLSLETDADFAAWNELHPDQQFYVWNRFRDHDFCRCLSASYKNSQGQTRFYFRCPGEVRRADYCRQLVYTADNLLVDGFGSSRRILLR